MKKKYKIEPIKARSMDDPPEEGVDFRYIHKCGTTGPINQKGFKPGYTGLSLGTAIGWIPAKVEVQEIIVPGWCEYRHDAGHNLVFWRHEDGRINTVHPSATPPKETRYTFIQQLTFGPQEDSK